MFFYLWWVFVLGSSICCGKWGNVVVDVMEVEYGIDVEIVIFVFEVNFRFYGEGESYVFVGIL